MAENIHNQRQQQLKQSRQQQAPAPQVATAGAAGVVCPACGTVNDAEATFCEQCGTPLREASCPKCGAKVDAQADFCENCQSYIGRDRCSFCGAPMSQTDEYCQECGSPRSGIVCPTCHSTSLFGFCGHCGTPLTDRARQEQAEAWKGDLAREAHILEQKLEELWRTKPVASKRERERRNHIEQVRKRVMQLLNENGDKAYPTATPPESRHHSPTTDELRAQTEQACKALQQLLDTMATQPTANPAQARNEAMARKPHISRLAWRCNYRSALHPSPLACACPQHGGQWVVLSGKDEQRLTADK